jgi:hypothetical protein
MTCVTPPSDAPKQIDFGRRSDFVWPNLKDRTHAPGRQAGKQEQERPGLFFRVYSLINAYRGNHAKPGTAKRWS